MDERIVSGRYDGGFNRCPRWRIHVHTAIRFRVSGEGIHRVKDGYVNDRCPARMNETAGSGSADDLEHVGIPLEDRVSTGWLRLDVSCAREQSRQNEK
jgi:hypothetical protein